MGRLRPAAQNDLAPGVSERLLGDLHVARRVGESQLEAGEGHERHAVHQQANLVTNDVGLAVDPEDDGVAEADEVARRRRTAAELPAGFERRQAGTALARLNRHRGRATGHLRNALSGIVHFDRGAAGRKGAQLSEDIEEGIRPRRACDDTLPQRNTRAEAVHRTTRLERERATGLEIDGRCKAELDGAALDMWQGDAHAVTAGRAEVRHLQAPGGIDFEIRATCRGVRQTTEGRRRLVDMQVLLEGSTEHPTAFQTATRRAGDVELGEDFLDLLVDEHALRDLGDDHIAGTIEAGVGTAADAELGKVRIALRQGEHAAPHLGAELLHVLAGERFGAVLDSESARQKHRTVEDETIDALDIELQRRAVVFTASILGDLHDVLHAGEDADRLTVVGGDVLRHRVAHARAGPGIVEARVILLGQHRMRRPAALALIADLECRDVRGAQLDRSQRIHGCGSRVGKQELHFVPDQRRTTRWRDRDRAIVFFHQARELPRPTERAFATTREQRRSRRPHADAADLRRCARCKRHIELAHKHAIVLHGHATGGHRRRRGNVNRTGGRRAAAAVFGLDQRHAVFVVGARKEAAAGALYVERNQLRVERQTPVVAAVVLAVADANRNPVAARRTEVAHAQPTVRSAAQHRIVQPVLLQPELRDREIGDAETCARRAAQLQRANISGQNLRIARRTDHAVAHHRRGRASDRHLDTAGHCDRRARRTSAFVFLVAPMSAKGTDPYRLRRKQARWHRVAHRPVRGRRDRT